MYHKGFKFILPLGLIFVFLFAASLALGQSPGGKAVPDGGDMSAPQAASPLLLSSEGTASVDVALGEPGTSFGYVKTYGHTDEPYLADTDHLNGPNGLVIDGNNDLYVVEQARGMRMLKYDLASGNNELVIGHAGFDWHHDDFLAWPIDVALAPNGHIWIVINPALKEFDQAGNLVQIFPEVDPWMSGTENDRFSSPRGLAFDSSGLLYVADTDNHRVQIYDISGGVPAYVDTIGTTGVAGTENEFNLPNQLAFDSQGRLYVTERGNERVSRCEKAADVWTCSEFLGVTLEPGDDLDHLDSPWGITIKNDVIYVADTINSRVLKCDLAGTCTLFAGETDVWDSAPGHFDLAADVAVDSAGNVYVSDRRNYRIQKFNAAGVYQGQIGETLTPYAVTGTYFNRPTGVTVDAAGNLYIQENWGNRLVKVKPDGSVAWDYGTPGLEGNTDDLINYPEGKPAVAADGKVYLTDSSNHRVLVLNPDGTLFTIMGETSVEGNANDHFAYPTGAAISPLNGDVFIVDRWNNRVQVFTKDRVYKATLGVVDECGADNQHFCDPWGVAVDKLGNIYIADTENMRVQKCLLSGSLYSCTTFAGETGIFGTDYGYMRPLDVAVDMNGNVYVADEWENQRIQVFSPTGAFLTSIGGTWSDGNNGFDNPWGVAVDADGNVYVADWLNMRIQVFAPGYPNWKQANINGFGDRLQTMVSTLVVYNGQMYAGTWPAADQISQVWRSDDGTHWTEFSPPWDADVTGGSAVFNGKLYIGVGTDVSGEVWRTDGSIWERVVAEGFGDPNVYWVNDLAAFSGYLYASTSDDDGNLQIYRSDTGNLNDWEPVDQNALGGDYSVSQDSRLRVYDNHLYLGLGRGGVAELWRTDNGVDWEAVFADGLAPNNTNVSAIEEFNGDLYIGVRNVVDGGEIWRSNDGLTFNPVAVGGLGDAANGRPYGLEAYNDEIFVSFTNYDTGAEIWKSEDGSHWVQSVDQGWGDSNNITATYFDKGIAVFGENLYFGTSNSANGGEVWQYTPQQILYLPLVLKNYTSPTLSTWKTFASPTSDNLHALDMVSTSAGWAVGDLGTILRWNGTTWADQTSPVSSDLTGIDLLDASTGWAVGDSGVILRWNGADWSSNASPTSTNLKDVHILAANDGWAVGEGGVILHWNGAAWSTVTSPTTYDLFAVDFVSPTDGWAVGGEWNTSIGWYEAAYLHWNGSTWSNYTPVMVLDPLFDVDLVSSSYGIAAGLNNAKSFWNGTSWNSRYTTPMMHYEGVEFLATNDGWAVGWEVGGNNIQHWDGSAWTQVACPTTLRLKDLHMFSSTRGWAVGDSGVILQYGP